MNALTRFGLKALHKIFGRPIPLPPPQYKGEEANELIYSALASDTPCMIGRLGNVELNCVVNSLLLDKTVTPGKILRYIRDKSVRFEWDRTTMYEMGNNAGFFPADVEHLERFAALMLEAIPKADILGSWLPAEVFIADRLRNTTTVRLPDLEPYYHENPWSRILEGKTVLVIHPFAKSIQSQYARREKLFRDRRVLPEFRLETIRAVQSAANTRTPFRDWFEALESMKGRIRERAFDVALIGCGAYGFPLGAYVKDLGRKAVHLGGALQILFGIRGARWDTHEFISRLYNDCWVRPLKEERPDRAEGVENACYW
ncbi:MAG: hypothetical protein LBR23_05155 [Spirochaetaceae bacterium]|jgi:hypothetical protein|nr:hypothetical protein [Spirochaetaceae bacterium]